MTAVKLLGVVVCMYLSACGGGGGTTSTPTPPANPQPTLSSITVTPASVTLIAGQTQQLTATGNYSDGSTKDLTSTATWSSSKTAVATVSSAGLLTTVASGQSTISAALSNVSGSDALTVNAKSITSISVTPQSQTLFLNTSQQLDAVATYNDGSSQDVTSAATWVSSAPNYATVSNLGVVSAVAAGDATITASSAGISSSAADVTVSSSNTGVTVVDDLTDGSLMLYWPGDGSLVTYYGTRNSDGTLAAIDSVRITRANKQSQVIRLDSQGRQDSVVFSDGTLFGFDWSSPSSPNLVITAPNQSPQTVACSTTTSATSAAAAKSQFEPRRQDVAANSTSGSNTQALVNVTTDCGSGPKPEDNAIVSVNVDYTFGGSPTGPIPASLISAGSGEYSANLPSGPTSLAPSVLQSSAVKVLSNVCSVPVPSYAATLCGPAAPECLAALEDGKLFCSALSKIQGFYSSINFLNKLIPPHITADVEVNGYGPLSAASIGTNFGAHIFQYESFPCKINQINVSPNPATVGVGSTIPLSAYATWLDSDGNIQPITSSTLNWSWQPNPGDQYLTVVPETSTTVNGAANKLGLSIANVAGNSPTITFDTVTATESDSGKTGTSQVTVGGLSLTVTWTVTAMQALNDIGWSGTDTLKITNGNYVYSGNLSSQLLTCVTNRTESGSGTFTITPPTTPGPFAFSLVLPASWTNTQAASGCDSEGGNGYSYGGSTTTPLPLTIQATPAPGGYTLSTNTTYPADAPYGLAQTTATASGFLSAP